jgi:hypothetical protein
MDVDRLFSLLNPLVVKLLQSPLHFLASGGLMTLSYTGRRSGRRITIPVGFQQSEGRVVVLVSKAVRKRWWHNFREPSEVELCIRSRRMRGRAQLIPAGSAEFAAAFQNTFERLPFLPRQFGISDFEQGVALNPDQLDILGREARMVTVSLPDTEGPG